MRLRKASRRYATFAAAVFTGLQGIVTLVIAKSALGDDFGPLAQLWAMWAVSAAALTYGTQQWAAVRPAGIRLFVERRGRNLAIVLAGLSLATCIVTYLLRIRLFSTPGLWWPLLAGLLPLGSSLIGLSRGELARTDRTYWLAAVITGENAIRLVGTIGLAILDASAEWYGAALVGGFAMALLPPSEHRSALALDVAPLTAAVGVGLTSHALLFGAPLILALSGGSADNAVLLFLVLSAVRAPFVLLQALIPQVAVRFGADTGGLRPTIRTLSAVGAAGAVAALAGGTLFGDAIVGPVFSIRGEVDGIVYGFIGGAALVSISLSLLTVRLVASGVVGPLLVSWIPAVVATLVGTIAGALDDIGVMAAWTFGLHAIVLAVLATLSSRAGHISDTASVPLGTLAISLNPTLATEDDPHSS